MNFDKETLIEIEDYIQALDEQVGLKPEAVIDINKAISKQRGLVKKLAIPDVVCCPSCGQEYEPPAPQCCIACSNFIYD